MEAVVHRGAGAIPAQHPISRTLPAHEVAAASAAPEEGAGILTTPLDREAVRTS